MRTAFFIVGERLEVRLPRFACNDSLGIALRWVLTRSANGPDHAVDMGGKALWIFHMDGLSAGLQFHHPDPGGQIEVVHGQSPVDARGLPRRIVGIAVSHPSAG